MTSISSTVFDVNANPERNTRFELKTAVFQYFEN